MARIDHLLTATERKSIEQKSKPLELTVKLYRVLGLEVESLWMSRWDVEIKCTVVFT